MAHRATAIALLDSLIDTYGEGPIDTLVFMLTVSLVLVLCYGIGRVIRHHLAGTPIGETSLVVNIVRAVIVIIAVFFLGENVFEIEMSGAVQALGITTLVVSLGLQDLIKSIVAGVLIVMGDIVSLGDQVTLGEHRGEVTDINWHQITIRDRDGIPHIIPNSVLMSGSFMRMTGKMACRHMFECDITPGVNLDLVKTDIETRAANVLTKHGWIAPGYGPQVMYMSSTAFGTRASIRIFICDIEYAVRSMDAVMTEIANQGYLADYTKVTGADWTEPGRHA